MNTAEQLKTSNIPIRDLKPCAFCKGPIVPIFYVIEIKHAVIDQGARDFVGFQVMGYPAALAEMFASGPGAKVLENNVRKIFVCNNCFVEKLPTELLAAWEKAAEG